jgi:hypothetical protein
VGKNKHKTRGRKDQLFAERFHQSIAVGTPEAALAAQNLVVKSLTANPRLTTNPALHASALPAWGAAGVEPMVALRNE